MIAAAGLVAGCVSTQTEASRLRVNDARIRDSQLVTQVSQAATGGSARVTGVTVVDHGRAFVVTIFNGSHEAVTDLPLSVGYRFAHGKPVYLNGRAGLPYFASHTAEIGAGATLRWVYSGAARLPPGSRPFAYVGSRADPAMAVQATPGVTARVLRRIGSQWVVQVSNQTSIPQYQLPIYLYVRDGERIVGAGVSALAELDGGATGTVRVTVIGSASTGNVTVSAPATIYN